MLELLMFLYTLCVIGTIFNTLNKEKKSNKIHRFSWIAIGALCIMWFWFTLEMINEWITP